MLALSGIAQWACIIIRTCSRHRCLWLTHGAIALLSFPNPPLLSLRQFKDMSYEMGYCLAGEELEIAVKQLDTDQSGDISLEEVRPPARRLRAVARDESPAVM